MKNAIILLITMFLNISYSAIGTSTDVTEADKQVEFDKRVQAEVDRQINLIKKKSIAQLTRELLQKESKLQKISKNLDFREEQLNKGESSLLKKIEQLENTKEKIIGCLDDHKRNEMMRIKQLVNVISNMKPQKAADLLSVQESGISVKIIERIDPQKASKLFNLMDKEVSARLQKQYLNMQQ